MTELYAALQPVLDEHDSFHQQQAQEDEEGKERAVQLAIMGLPNVVGNLPLPHTCLFVPLPLATSIFMQLFSPDGLVKPTEHVINMPCLIKHQWGQA